jgi:hypothetical protein
MGLGRGGRRRAGDRCLLCRGGRGAFGSGCTATEREGGRGDNDDFFHGIFFGWLVGLSIAARNVAAEAIRFHGLFFPSPFAGIRETPRPHRAISRIRTPPLVASQWECVLQPGNFRVHAEAAAIPRSDAAGTSSRPILGRLVASPAYGTAAAGIHPAARAMLSPAAVLVARMALGRRRRDRRRHRGLLLRRGRGTGRRGGAGTKCQEGCAEGARDGEFIHGICFVSIVDFRPRVPSPGTGMPWGVALPSMGAASEPSRKLDSPFR